MSDTVQSHHITDTDPAMAAAVELVPMRYKHPSSYPVGTLDIEGVAADRKRVANIIRRHCVTPPASAPASGETPRTDAEINRITLANSHDDYSPAAGQFVSSYFARQLERELNEVKAELRAMQEHHAATEAIIADARGLRPEDGKALLHNYDQLRARAEAAEAKLAEVEAQLMAATKERDDMRSEQGKRNDKLGILDHCQIEPLITALRSRLALVDELAGALEEARRAIDVLWAERISADKAFFPSKHSTWPTLTRVSAAITRYNAAKERQQ